MSKFKLGKNERQRVTNRLKKLFDDTIDPKLLKEIGDETVANNKGLLREGKDPATGKRQQKKTFSDKYSSKAGKKKKRERIADTNTTHPAYRRSYTNATITGEFIDSLTYEIDKKGLSFFFDGDHKGYKKVSGGRSQSSSNDEIANGLTKAGYNLIGVSNKWIKEISKIIRDALRRQL